MQDGFCGEEIGGVFYLTAAVAPVVEVDCEIPAGVPIVGTPGGSIGVMPWDGDTEEGSFIRTLYPASPPIPAEGAKVASAAWVVRIHPLAPGQHELMLADELFDGTWVPFTATFNITVRPGPR